MRELRIHGRGGQGSVTAAELIAVAAFEGGVYAQAFPAFGVERRGAPVQALSGLTTKKSGSAARCTNLIISSCRTAR